MSDHRGEEALRLASADNFRDVAGPGYATRDGRQVNQGIFYRANELRLTDDDAATLADLGLRTVLDLRTEPEIELHPDKEIDGARWHHFDVFGIPMEEVWGLDSRDRAIEVMHTVYDSFVTATHSREEFGRLFRQLATGPKQLFHCTAGKDRTGWTAALLLHLAGVDDATIESDYLLTNSLAAGSRARVENLIAEGKGEEFVHVLEPTLIVDVDYLRTGWRAVEEQYGDRATYLRHGLGLPEETIGQLRGLLLD